MREEPVLFVNKADDFIPYTIKSRKNLRDCVVTGKLVKEADLYEASIRKRVRVWLDLNIFRFHEKCNYQEDHLNSLQYSNLKRIHRFCEVVIPAKRCLLVVIASFKIFKSLFLINMDLNSIEPFLPRYPTLPCHSQCNKIRYMKKRSQFWIYERRSKQNYYAVQWKTRSCQNEIFLLSLKNNNNNYYFTSRTQIVTWNRSYSALSQ
ncbi:hypothetical protein MAR_029526 [Mya arenaria]|uniref:Uncharacterized protein n=1 Tax=Mya arenaria TaxID=6604 RepID=A0ABY7DIP7_MYAAR|nr:hypothetical protein MAR_029526 [Mya arenaria]